MRFLKDYKRYYKYSKYAAKSALNAEVAGSYLNWLWWVFNPLCMMFVYSFVFGYVFGGRLEYFEIFIFTGITLWNFFATTVTESVRLVKKNKSIVTKVYLPKFVLVITQMRVQWVKMLISFAIVVGMLIVFRVPLTLNVFWIFPVLVTLFILTFGVACVILHFGVFVEDLNNVVRILLRFTFYATGVFYSIEVRLGKKNPAWANLMLHYNPMALLLDSFRKALLYGQTPHYKWIGAWFVTSLIICFIGVRLIYRYENSYAKII